MKEALQVIKIGGNVIDNEVLLSKFLVDISSHEGKKIIVHGGGKLATHLANKLDIKQTMIEGRRVTDKETLDIVTMVYAGLINKSIVAQLQSLGSNSIGMSGADGNVIVATKRQHPSIDYGFVGDVVSVNGEFIDYLLRNDMTPVFCAITHDTKGQLLNTNADTIAQEIAVALSEFYYVSLVYIFEKAGVLRDVDNEDSVIPTLSVKEYMECKANGLIHSGMIPKLDNAFKAIKLGVNNVKIGKSEDLKAILNEQKGTKIL
jgi:acetylglutamate kinase